MVIAYLSIGSNEGDTLDNVLTAIGEIVKIDGVQPAGMGSFYETEPQDKPDQEWFLNTAIAVNTDLEPETLLMKINEIEDAMGRKREERYGPRLIDIDIIFYGELAMRSDHLTIPHPKAAMRRFVLAPLADIDETFVHPTLGKTVGELLLEIPDDEQAIRKAGP